jgi:hypothetical protein
MTDPRESGLLLDPKFDANGLLTAVVVDVADGEVLMVGHMNHEALQVTQGSGQGHLLLAQPPAPLDQRRKQWPLPAPDRAAYRL